MTPEHNKQASLSHAKMLFSTFLAVSWICGGQHTSWMKNQREPNDGKEAMREHGKHVKIMFSCKNNVVFCVFFKHWADVFSCREVLKEDESGSLKASVEEILFQSKRKRWVCVYMQRHTLHFCSTAPNNSLTIVRCGFPIHAIVNCFYFILQGSLPWKKYNPPKEWSVLQHSLAYFLKSHRMIESYGQVRLGMVSWLFFHILLCFQYHIT